VPNPTTPVSPGRQAELERIQLEYREAAAKQEWDQYYRLRPWTDIQTLPGREFEQFLAKLFAKMGYEKMQLTAVTDQGADLICEKDGVRYVVQAKRWQRNVGNGAVQEVLGAMVYYQCGAAIVITTSGYTLAARALAAKDSRIVLRDGDWLRQAIVEHFTSDVPEFNWDVYNTEVKPQLGEIKQAGSTYSAGVRWRGSYRRRYRRRYW
jgi:hypothetical protein